MFTSINFAPGSAPACRHFHRCGSSYQSTASSPLKYRFCLSRANQMPAPSPKVQGVESRPPETPITAVFAPRMLVTFFSVPAPESIESAHSALFFKVSSDGTNGIWANVRVSFVSSFSKAKPIRTQVSVFSGTMCSFCAARGRFYEYPAPKNRLCFSKRAPPARTPSPFLCNHMMPGKNEILSDSPSPRSRRHSHRAARS